MINPQKNGTEDQIQRLEAEVRLAELSAQKAEARLRLLETEEKIRELQARRQREVKRPAANG
jgi:hypothetical protein